MRTLLAKLLPALVLAALAALWVSIVTVLAAPALLDGLEPWAGRPLDFEESVRAVLVTALSLFMLVWGAFLIGRATMVRLCAFVAVLLAVSSVVFVSINDLDQPLSQEYSWIRYPTAFFLVAAAAVAVAIARGYGRAGAPKHRHLWVVLAIAFVGLAGDEILMLHEAFGTFIQSRFHATHFATDLVTIVYPVVALGFVIFLSSQRAYLREYLTRHTAFLALFASAAIVFLVGQMGDTFDRWTHEKLTAWGVTRSADPKLLFSDFWYPLWGPRQLLNDLEEVFECIASALFFASFGVLLIEQRRPGLGARRMFVRPVMSLSLIGALVIGISAVAIRLASGRSIDSPAIGHEAKALLGPRDGLFHTDVVFFHPRWGLLIANEGRGNVVRYQNGAATVLPDPGGLVTDTDCVTATDAAIYVSSPSLHTIFEYTEAGGWRPFLTAENGMRYPEALVVVDSIMYVIDEESHVISVIDMASKQLRDIPLTGPRWSRPEGIAFHPGLGQLLITDDTGGTLATVDPSGTVALFADQAQGLANPEDVCVTRDGRIFVTDTGRREIIEFTADGRVSQRIRFHPMYGYLVGVAVVEAQTAGEPDRIYAVNSDGYSSMSFIPSTLWELTLSDGAR